MSFPLLLALPWLALGPPRWAADLERGRSEAARARVTFVDVGALDGERIRLELFEDVAVEAVRDAVVPFGPEDFVWLGRIERDVSSSIVLSVRSGVLSGSVRTARGQFRIRSAGAGLYRMEEVPPEPPARLPLAAGSQRATTLPRPAGDDGSVIDLLVVFTPRARRAAGGVGAMESLVQLGVAETNLAFELSGVSTRVRLVHLQEVSYVEAGRVESDLEILKQEGDAALDEVLELRERHGADFVQLVVEERDGCGIAYALGRDDPGFAEWAFSVVERGCIDSTYAMAHELGHNFGCDHAPEDPMTKAAFAYSFGYKDVVSGFRTIMAYGPGRRLPRFSSPRRPFGGLATGTVRQDNARSLNEIRRTLARFRASVPPPRLVAAPGRGEPTSFRIVDEGAGVVEWRLLLGTSPGANDAFDSGSRSASETAAYEAVVEGRDVHARLWYRRERVWLYEDFRLR